MKQLRLSKDLALPLDAVTQTFAILGKRGSGKTTTATVLTEELLEAGFHVVVIDPLDVTWGLRSSRDGKSAGYPITVLGGDHADLPLEATAGAVLAEFVVQHRSPVILSLRHFSMADQRRFVTDFCEKLYALKGQTANRTPLHLVIDEADEFAPQRIPPGGERMFGAIDRIVRRGRSAGLGVTLISQRAAVLNKDVLSQAEVLVCHQTISPQDRKALEAWIQAHDAHGQASTFMGSLASLERGEAWVWSPGWLDVFKRVGIRDRVTFDSSATPKAGAVVQQPKQLAPVDLDALRTQIAGSIEKAKADDPRELRKEIADLKRQLAKGAAQVQPKNEPIAQVKTVERFVLKDGQLARAEKLVEQIGATFDRAKPLLEQLEAQRLILEVAIEKTRTLAPPASQVPPRTSHSAPAPRPPAVQKRTAPVIGSVSSKSGEGRMLVALAQYPDGMTDSKLAILSGMTKRGGSFRTYLSKLRVAGYVTGDRGRLQITEAGLAAAGQFEPLPTGQALLDYWRGELGDSGARKIFDALIEAYPQSMDKDDLAAASEMTAAGGSFRTYLSKLRVMGLLAEGRELRASEELFS